ncbi:MAG: hypothetical protein N4A40_15690 [Tissierellales bacterium]|jgi:hypothetical protein|nr:hypothetical protein [Tissierellales bacterium]
MESQKIKKIQELLDEKIDILVEVLDLTQLGEITSDIIGRKEELIFRAENIDNDFGKLYNIEEMNAHNPKEDIKSIQHSVKQLICLTEEIQKYEELNYAKCQKKNKAIKTKLRDAKPAKRSVQRYKSLEDQYKNKKI